MGMKLLVPTRPRIWGNQYGSDNSDDELKCQQTCQKQIGCPILVCPLFEGELTSTLIGKRVGVRSFRQNLDKLDHFPFFKETVFILEDFENRNFA